MVNHRRFIARTRAAALTVGLAAALPSAHGEITDVAPANIPAGTAADVVITLDPAPAQARASLFSGGPRVIATARSDKPIRAMTSAGADGWLAAGEGVVLRWSASDEAWQPLHTAKASFHFLAATDALTVAADRKEVYLWTAARKKPVRWKAPAPIVAVAAGDGTVWAALQNGALQQIRLTDKGRLEGTASVATVCDRIEHISAQGGRVLVSCGSQGIRLVTAGEGGELSVSGHHRTTGSAHEAAWHESHAVVATSDGLVILTVDDGGNLQWLASHQNLGAVRRVAVNGGQAVALNDSGVVFQVDLGNPQEPTVVNAVAAGGDGTMLAAKLPVVVVGAAGSATAFDFGPRVPALSNQNLDAGQGVNYGGQRKGVIRNDVLFVADWFSGIHIYDIRHPRIPVLLSSYHTPGSPKGVAVKGDYAFVADDDHGLQVLHIGDLSSPRLVASLATSGLAYTPVIQGDLLYLASHRGGFQIIDISAPASPAVIGEYDTPGKAWFIAVRDQTAYVADSESGLLVFDVSDPATPRLIGEYNPGGNAEDVWLDGKLAYVAFFEGGVHVLDISEPSRAVAVAQLQTPGNARGLELRGDRLYVADWLAGIHVVDVADPTQPKLTGSVDTRGAAWGLRVSHGHAYVFDWWGGLAVVDVSDEAAPKTVYRYPVQSAVNGLIASGKFLFAAQNQQGLQVYDINNPLNPTWATGIHVGAPVLDLARAGRFALAATAGAGLAVVDIHDPFRPRWVGAAAESAHVTKVAVSGELAAAMERDGTLTVYDLSQLPYPMPVATWTGKAKGVAALEDGFVLWDDEGGLSKLAVGADGRATVAWRVPGKALRFGAADDLVAAVETESTLVVYRSIERGMRQLDRIDVQERLVAVEVSGGRIIGATPTRLLIYEVGANERLALVSRFPLTGTPLGGMLTLDHRIYGAAASGILAVQAPEPMDQHLDGVRLVIRIPATLPAGSYDLMVQAGDRVPLQRSNAITVDPLRFGKPKMTMEQFKQLLEQKRGTQQ